MENYSRIFEISRKILKGYNENIYKPQGIRISGSGFVKALSPLVKSMSEDKTLPIFERLIELKGRAPISELEQELRDRIPMLRARIRALAWKYKLVSFEKKNEEEEIVLKDLITALRDYYMEDYSKFRKELQEIDNVEIVSVENEIESYS